MNYYLITDHTQDGHHEYTDLIPVRATQPKENWEDNWENYFLAWQFTIDWIDGENGEAWSNDRIVSVRDVTDITKEEYEVLGEHLGLFNIDEIIKQGKEVWNDDESLQEAWDTYNQQWLIY